MKVSEAVEFLLRCPQDADLVMADNLPITTIDWHVASNTVIVSDSDEEWDDFIHRTQMEDLDTQYANGDISCIDRYEAKPTGKTLNFFPDEE